MATAKSFNELIRLLEYILAGIVIAGIIAMLFSSIQMLIGMDWGSLDVFYEMIRRVLALVIGLELARMLITHNLNVVLELLAFVIARKMLLPDLEATEIILSVLAFVILMIARHFMFQDDIVIEKEKI